jgi:SAM-dependent methyltransferase
MKDILDLGCGDRKYKEDGARVTGLDKYNVPGVDVVHDINKPLPFKANSFDKVVSRFVFEQIRPEKLPKLMKEIHRILRPFGVLELELAYYSGWAQWNDPLHVNFFSYYSFDRYEKDHRRKYREEYLPKFNIKERKLIFGRGVTKFLNPIINPFVNAYPRFYSRFLSWILPCVEIRFKLEAAK